MSTLRTNIVEAFTAKEVSIKGVRCLDTRSRLNGIIKYKGNKFLFRQDNEWVELGYGGMTLEDVLVLIGPLEDSIAALESAVASVSSGPTSGELSTFHKFFVSQQDMRLVSFSPSGEMGMMLTLMGLKVGDQVFPEVLSTLLTTGIPPTSWDGSLWHGTGTQFSGPSKIEDMRGHDGSGIATLAFFDLPHSPGLILNKFCVKYTLSCWPNADPTAVVPFGAVECLIYNQVGSEGIPETPGFNPTGAIMPLLDGPPLGSTPVGITLPDVADGVRRDAHVIIGSANPPAIPLSFSSILMNINPATNGFIIPDSGHSTPASRAELGTHIVEYTLATPLRLDTNKVSVALFFTTDPPSIDVTSGVDTDGDGICDEDCEVDYMHAFGVHGATLFLTSDLEVTLT